MFTILSNDFIGYIEPDQITMGKADVIVTDGFTGNIALKTAEGLSNFIMNNFKKVFTKNMLNNIAYLILRKDLVVFSNTINPIKYNGAMVLGLNSVVVKSHGSASPEAFAQALNNCSEYVKKDINKKSVRWRFEMNLLKAHRTGLHPRLMTKHSLFRYMKPGPWFLVQIA